MTRMRGRENGFLLLFSCLVLACDSSSDTPHRDWRVPTDGSLEAAQYEHLGVPSVERAWASQDHLQALSVLQSVDRENLPRFGSPRSGRVFDRLTESFERAVKDPQSLRSRPGEVPPTLGELYEARESDKLFFDRELVEIQIAAARATAGMIGEVAHGLEELDEFYRSSQGKDEDAGRVRTLYERRRDQLNRSGVQIVSGLLAVLHVPSVQPTTSAAVVEALVTWVPRITESMPSTFSAVVAAMIHESAGSIEDSVAKARLMELAESIRA